MILRRPRSSASLIYDAKGMVVEAGARSRQHELMEWLRSALVSYLDGRGTLARRGYVQIPVVPDLPRIETREQLADVLDEFKANLADQRAALLEAESNTTETMQVVLGAFAAAAAKVRNDLAWQARYAEAGTTVEEEAFTRGGAARFRDAS